ncbi:YdeI/OmpD-associated family protein [Streptomyces sp. NPDC051214]|uniref:YdeI/OmpD-associated family protein n=1 Tax=Streptomyces sp. NPDC051214 TaxID=3155282 RepID=UPI003433F106
MESPDGLQVVTFVDAARLAAWLDEHHAGSPGVWVRLAKKGSGVASVTSAEVNDAALCYGWITGHRKAYDEVHYLQKITPRRPRSLWSQVNVDRVAELTAEGRMREPGLAEVAAAKADGRWDAAYESQRNATVPDDLAQALAAAPKAGKTFETLSRTERYAVLHSLMTARTPATRASRLDRVVAKLARGSAP